jgi:hypothetical protein
VDEGVLAVGVVSSFALADDIGRDDEGLGLFGEVLFEVQPAARGAVCEDEGVIER